MKYSAGIPHHPSSLMTDHRACHHSSNPIRQHADLRYLGLY